MSRTAPLKDWLTFVSVTMAAAVSAATWTLPNAVLPQMQGDLSATLDQVSWVVTAAVVAGAIGLPLTPWLSSRLGAKKLMVFSLGSFSAASIMVGTVNSIEEVVFWRVCSAFTGAPLIALSQAVTMSTFPPKKRALVFSLWSVGMGSGWVFAPTFGAWLADIISWRLTFLSVAPFGFVATLLCITFMPHDKTGEKTAFDWTGFITLAIFLTMIQVVVNQGHRLDWFDSDLLLLLTGIGALSLYLYVVHTIHCRTPFLSWEMFLDRNLTCGVLITAIYAYIGLIPLVLIPTMMEELRGADVFTSGLVILPRGIAQLTAMIAAGFLASRLDPRYLIGFGLTVYALTSWYMSHYNPDIGIYDVTAPTIIQGAALGFIWVPAMGLMYATLSDRLQASAATFVSLTYSLSSSFGVAAAVVVLGRSSQITSEELGAYIEPSREMLKQSARITDFSAVNELAAIANEIALQASVISYANVNWLLTVSALAAIPLAFLLRKPK